MSTLLNYCLTSMNLHANYTIVSTHPHQHQKMGSHYITRINKHTNQPTTLPPSQFLIGRLGYIQQEWILCWLGVQYLSSGYREVSKVIDSCLSVLVSELSLLLTCSTGEQLLGETSCRAEELFWGKWAARLCGAESKDVIRLFLYDDILLARKLSCDDTDGILVTTFIVVVWDVAGVLIVFER